MVDFITNVRKIEEIFWCYNYVLIKMIIFLWSKKTFVAASEDEKKTNLIIDSDKYICVSSLYYY